MHLIRRLKLLTAACLLALGTGAAAAGDVGRPVDVVELFTSQGCSSCPLADALLGQLKDRDNVLALSFAVDYWDYLGWKDTFGDPANSVRQRAYAHERGDRAVYTPQAVVNGLNHVVGSNLHAVDGALSDTRASLGAKPVPLSVSADGKTLTITAGAATADLSLRSGTIMMVLYEPAREVAVKRGENRGRTLTYHNIVRAMKPVGTWRGSETEIAVKLDHAMAPGKHCAILLQAGGPDQPGPILAAAVVEGAL